VLTDELQASQAEAGQLRKQVGSLQAQLESAQAKLTQLQAAVAAAQEAHSTLQVGLGRGLVVTSSDETPCSCVLSTQGCVGSGRFLRRFYTTPGWLYISKPEGHKIAFNSANEGAWCRNLFVVLASGAGGALC